MRQVALCGFLLFISHLPGCQPAGRYQALESPEKKKEIPFSPSQVWMKPKPAAFDLPILFIPDSNPEWAQLPAFWNHFPRPPAGLPTCHLGQTPLEALSAMVLAAQGEAVKIKVPRGLPDPTSNIPGSNPPTLAAWQLGKSLFFDKILVISEFEIYSCSKCHDPKHGFCEDYAFKYGRKNAPSLLNCVYNKHQFWDGRVKTLEQVVFRNSEKVTGERQAQEHNWTDLVSRLRKSEVYQKRFKQVYGIPPTQDIIVKALATYMRTILSGNSVYDRTLAARGKDNELIAKHFEAALKNDDLNALGQGKKAETAVRLGKGSSLFFGKARCSQCHFAPLFTDQDFHNIGLEFTDFDIPLGRLAQVPVGRKEGRLQGAYKTPTLRNLPRTEPYMHNGKFKTLEEVVDYFDRGINPQDSLAAQLMQSPGEPQRLSLTKEEIGDLVLFLRALDGAEIDPVLRAPNKK